MYTYVKIQIVIITVYYNAGFKTTADSLDVYNMLQFSKKKKKIHQLFYSAP